MKKKLRLSFNAPAVLGFVGLCVIAQIISMLTGGQSSKVLFSVYRASMADPLTYVRLFAHVLGHAGWDHLLGNMMYILILGPMIEEKYGTGTTVFIIAVTALVIGIINMAFFPGVRLLGASGVVFAMILLSSITRTQDGAIPLTFILVAALYVGQQVWQAVTAHDNVSYMAHIAGGAVGAALGFGLNKISIRRR